RGPAQRRVPARHVGPAQLNGATGVAAEDQLVAPLGGGRGPRELKVDGRRTAQRKSPDEDQAVRGERRRGRRCLRNRRRPGPRVHEDPSLIPRAVPASQPAARARWYEAAGDGGATRDGGAPTTPVRPAPD